MTFVILAFPCYVFLSSYEAGLDNPETMVFAGGSPGFANLFLAYIFLGPHESSDLTGCD